MRALSDDQIQQFIRDGFVRIDQAFPRELADEARAILWRDTGCNPHNPATWTKPVIRLSGYKDPPFLKAERTPVLHAAFVRRASKMFDWWMRGLARPNPFSTIARRSVFRAPRARAE